MSEQPDAPTPPPAPGDEAQPRAKKLSTGQKVAIGVGAGAAGCLVAIVGIIVVTISALTILGDLFSGGQVPGHGQADINQAASNISGVGTLFALLAGAGVIAAFVWLANRKK